MDWHQQIIDLTGKHFKSYGIVYTPKLDVHSCLVDFMNLDMKLIKSVPRTIFKSTEFKQRLLPPSYQRALSYIENKIINGNDVTFHQSKKTLDPSFNDLLLNDWIIHHLHVSNTKSQEKQKFYDRSKYLLFVGFSSNQAFFIDVRPHDEPYVFARKQLLEILDRNWPVLLKESVSEELFTSEYSDTEIHNLRKKGYTIGATRINGRSVISPGLGITTSGHNIHVVRRANAVLKILYDIFEEITNNEESIRNEISTQVGYEVTKLNFEIRQVSHWPFFVVCDPSTDCYIQKNYGK